MVMLLAQPMLHKKMEVLVVPVVVVVKEDPVEEVVHLDKAITVEIVLPVFVVEVGVQEQWVVQLMLVHHRHILL